MFTREQDTSEETPPLSSEASTTLQRTASSSSSNQGRRSSLEARTDSQLPFRANRNSLQHQSYPSVATEISYHENCNTLSSLRSESCEVTISNESPRPSSSSALETFLENSFTQVLKEPQALEDEGVPHTEVSVVSATSHLSVTPSTSVLECLSGDLSATAPLYINSSPSPLLLPSRTDEDDRDGGSDSGAKRDTQCSFALTNQDKATSSLCASSSDSTGVPSSSAAFRNYSSAPTTVNESPINIFSRSSSAYHDTSHFASASRGEHTTRTVFPLPPRTISPMGSVLEPTCFACGDTVDRSVRRVLTCATPACRRPFCVRCVNNANIKGVHLVNLETHLCAICQYQSEQRPNLPPHEWHWTFNNHKDLDFSRALRDSLPPVQGLFLEIHAVRQACWRRRINNVRKHYSFKQHGGFFEGRLQATQIGNQQRAAAGNANRHFSTLLHPSLLQLFGTSTKTRCSTQVPGLRSTNLMPSTSQRLQFSATGSEPFMTTADQQASSASPLHSLSRRGFMYTSCTQLVPGSLENDPAVLAGALASTGSSSSSAATAMDSAKHTSQTRRTSSVVATPSLLSLSAPSRHKGTDAGGSSPASSGYIEPAEQHASGVDEMRKRQAAPEMTSHILSQSPSSKKRVGMTTEETLNMTNNDEIQGCLGLHDVWFPDAMEDLSTTPNRDTGNKILTTRNEEQLASPLLTSATFTSGCTIQARDGVNDCVASLSSSTAAATNSVSSADEPTHSLNSTSYEENTEKSSSQDLIRMPVTTDSAGYTFMMDFLAAPSSGYPLTGSEQSCNPSTVGFSIATVAAQLLASLDNTGSLGRTSLVTDRRNIVRPLGSLPVSEASFIETGVSRFHQKTSLDCAATASSTERGAVPQKPNTSNEKTIEDNAAEEQGSVTTWRRRFPALNKSASLVAIEAAKRAAQMATSTLSSSSSRIGEKPCRDLEPRCALCCDFISRRGHEVMTCSVQYCNRVFCNYCVSEEALNGVIHFVSAANECAICNYQHCKAQRFHRPEMLASSAWHIQFNASEDESFLLDYICMLPTIPGVWFNCDSIEWCVENGALSGAVSANPNNATPDNSSARRFAPALYGGILEARWEAIQEAVRLWQNE